MHLSGFFQRMAIEQGVTALALPVVDGAGDESQPPLHFLPTEYYVSSSENIEIDTLLVCTESLLRLKENGIIKDDDCIKLEVVDKRTFFDDCEIPRSIMLLSMDQVIEDLMALAKLHAPNNSTIISTSWLNRAKLAARGIILENDLSQVKSTSFSFDNN